MLIAKQLEANSQGGETPLDDPEAYIASLVQVAIKKQFRDKSEQHPSVKDKSSTASL